MEENINQGTNNVQQELEESSSFNFRTIFTALVLNWQWFVLSIVICLSAAAIKLRYATPIYQSYAKLLIKEDEDNILTGEDAWIFRYKRCAWYGKESEPGRVSPHD